MNIPIFLLEKECKCHSPTLWLYLTCIISDIIVWVEAANVVWLYHMLVPYFSVVWIV